MSESALGLRDLLSDAFSPRDYTPTHSIVGVSLHAWHDLAHVSQVLDDLELSTVMADADLNSNPVYWVRRTRDPETFRRYMLTQAGRWYLGKKIQPKTYGYPDHDEVEETFPLVCEDFRKGDGFLPHEPRLYIFDRTILIAEWDVPEFLNG